MDLSLTLEEARELRQALGLHLHGLRTELTRTEDRIYRRSLRSGIERLEEIERRLVDLIGPSREAAAPAPP